MSWGIIKSETLTEHFEFRVWTKVLFHRHMHIQRTNRKTKGKEAFHFYWNRERKKTPVLFLMTLTVVLISRASMYWKVILGSLAIDVPRKWRHRITPLNFLFFLSANKVFNVSLWKRNSRSLLVPYFFKTTSLLKDFFTFVYCNTLNSKYTSFLTRELRACQVRVVDTMWRMAFAHSLDRSIPVNFFSILGFWVHLIVFGEQ